MPQETTTKSQSAQTPSTTKKKPITLSSGVTIAIVAAIAFVVFVLPGGKAPVRAATGTATSPHAVTAVQPIAPEAPVAATALTPAAESEMLTQTKALQEQAILQQMAAVQDELHSLESKLATLQEMLILHNKAEYGDDAAAKDSVAK